MSEFSNGQRNLRNRISWTTIDYDGDPRTSNDVDLLGITDDIGTETGSDVTDDIEENYPEISIFEDQDQEKNNSIGSTIIKISNDRIKLIRQGDGIFTI